MMFHFIVFYLTLMYLGYTISLKCFFFTFSDTSWSLFKRRKFRWDFHTLFFKIFLWSSETWKNI